MRALELNGLAFLLLSAAGPTFAGCTVSTPAPDVRSPPVPEETSSALPIDPAAAPATPPAATGASADPPRSGRADGAACSAAADCQSGVCEGEGCGTDEAHCAPAARGCTRDLRSYCGCDGATFRTSGNCPARPYRHKGECP